MNDKYNKIMATGLIAAMLASISACDKNNTIKPNDIENNVSEWVGMVEDFASEGNTKKDPFKGDVWNIMKQNGWAYKNSITNSDDPNTLPIPTTFLLGEGLLRKNGNIFIKYGSEYAEYESAIFTTDNEQNDVYVLVQYASGGTMRDDPNPNIWLATYMLKYTLDDDDYETFLGLDGDCRARYFIQAMDSIYQPEVISESNIIHEIVAYYSPYFSAHSSQKGFPKTYCVDVDYDTKTLTFAAWRECEYATYKINIRESQVWETFQKDYFLSDKECESRIKMDTEDTVAGPCLVNFAIGSQVVRQDGKWVKEQYQNSIDVLKLNTYSSKSENNKFTYENSK